MYSCRVLMYASLTCISWEMNVDRSDDAVLGCGLVISPSLFSTFAAFLDPVPACSMQMAQQQQYIIDVCVCMYVCVCVCVCVCVIHWHRPH